MRRSLKAKLVPALPPKASSKGASSQQQLAQSRSSVTSNASSSKQQPNNAATSTKMKTVMVDNGEVAIKAEDVKELEEAPEKPKALTTFNPLMTCILCGGYFVDATTIVECLDTCK